MSSRFILLLSLVSFFNPIATFAAGEMDHVTECYKWKQKVEKRLAAEPVKTVQAPVTSAGGKSSTSIR